MTSRIRGFRQTAETAARRGGEVLRQRFSTPRTVELKGKIDLVTDADRASEAAVLEHLRTAGDSFPIVAEETAADDSRRPSGPCWYIDPLDGTTNYAHGVPHFSVSVALWGEEGPLAGAVYHPLLDDMYTAGSGDGAHLNGQPLQVSQRAPLSNALVGTGFPYDIWSNPEGPLRLFTPVLGRARGLRRFGSAALDLAFVAAGRFDAYFELGLFPWDVAAGILLVQEAGGRVSDLRGEAPRLRDRQILAANPALHAELLTLLGPLAPPVA